MRLRRTEDEIDVFGQKIQVIKRVCYELSRVDPMNVFPPYCAASVNKAADLFLAKTSDLRNLFFTCIPMDRKVSHDLIFHTSLPVLRIR